MAPLFLRRLLDYFSEHGVVRSAAYPYPYPYPYLHRYPYAYPYPYP